jgi:7-cyano-7-deazaguanine synthase
VDYGQLPAEAEEAAGRAVCETVGISFEVVRADCSSIGSGDMAGKIALEAAPVSEWWPFRNQLILTIAGSIALKLGLTELIIGALRTDDAHADGRPEFVDAISNLMRIQEGGLTVSAPAINMSAPELVQTSGIPKAVLAWAHSCHTSNFACGQCRGCIKHYLTWKALGWSPY